MPLQTRSQRRMISFLALAAAVLIACRTLFPSGEAPPLPTPTAAVFTPEPTPAPISTTAAATSSSAALRTCDLEVQAHAMRAGQNLDWASLELNACYRLKLDLTGIPGEYSGAAQISFNNTTGEELDEVVFRTYPNANKIYGGRLDITKALAGGAPVQPKVYLDDRTAVSLPLAKPLPAGESLEIELDFTGQVPQDFNGGSRLYGTFNYTTEDRVLTLANWFPLLAPWLEGGWQVEPVSGIGDAVVSQSALYLVEVTAPEDWQVVATGSPIDSNSANGETMTTFASGPARDFFITASPAFVLRTQEVNGVHINHWGLYRGRTALGGGPSSRRRFAHHLRRKVRSIPLCGAGRRGCAAPTRFRSRISGLVPDRLGCLFPRSGRAVPARDRCVPRGRPPMVVRRCGQRCAHPPLAR